MIKLLVTRELLFIFGMIGSIFAATASVEQDLEGILDHNNDIDEDNELYHEKGGGRHEGETEYWDYDHQHNWGGMCNKGKRQSPIELDYDVAEERYFPPFNFSNADTPYRVNISFNGHTVRVVFIQETSSYDSPRSTTEEDPTTTPAPTPAPPSGPWFNGGGYPGDYVLNHLHFHWNSEHTINNYRHPAEAHLVHYKKEYGDLESAKNYSDGIAVIAVLFDLSPEDDTILAIMMNDIEATGHHGVPEITSKYKLTYNHFIPRDTAGYFRYRGSLTTPNCEEVVIWTVFTNTIPISMKQLKVFQQCKRFGFETLEKNYRHIQDANHRPIYVKTSPLIYSNTKSVKATAFSIVMPFFIYIFMEVIFKLCQNSIL